MEDSEKVLDATQLKTLIIRMINEEDDISVLNFILRLVAARDQF